MAPTSRPRQTGGDVRQRQCINRSTSPSRTIALLLFLVCFGGFWDWDIWDSMVQNIDASTSVLRKSTGVSTSSNATFRERDASKNSNINNNNTIIAAANADSWIDPFEKQPGCTLLKQLARDGTNPKGNLSMRGILESYGKYVPTAHSSSSEPRYDHRSCFLMRPRYNCARSNQNIPSTLSNTTASATDFALILKVPTTATKTPATNRSNIRNKNKNHETSSLVCDLQKFVDDAGGPAGVGFRLLQNYQKARDASSEATKTTSKDRDTSLIEVLLVGTSRFRQIFEALVCGFSHQMTNLKIQLGGPVFNVQHKYMDAEEIGPLVGLDFVRNGSCYEPKSQANYSEFFRTDGTIVPNNHDRCNDNIAMVEFGLANNANNAQNNNSSSSSSSSSSKNNETANNNTTQRSVEGSRIRFYYVFRPWAWTNVTPALKALGIQNRHKLDFDLWEPRDVSDAASWQYSSTFDLESLYQRIFDIRSSKTNRTDVSSIEQHDAHELYKRIQQRDIGQYFGADNPWINDPPDAEHPCMPGMPDDKVNFLLWYMLSLSTMEQEEEGPDSNKQ